MSEPYRRRRILVKHEDALRRAIATGCSAEKIEKAAEKVREAKISFFKGQRDLVYPSPRLSVSKQNHLLRLTERETIWREKTNSEIVEEYR